MEFTVVIKADGKQVVEVTNRQEHLCSKIYEVTASLGAQLSDEELPDCAATAHVSVDGDLGLSPFFHPG